jgi:hypothetical protein
MGASKSFMINGLNLSEMHKEPNPVQNKRAVFLDGDTFLKSEAVAKALGFKSTDEFVNQIILSWIVFMSEG